MPAHVFCILLRYTIMYVSEPKPKGYLYSFYPIPFLTKLRVAVQNSFYFWALNLAMKSIIANISVWCSIACTYVGIQLLIYSFHTESFQS